MDKKSGKQRDPEDFSLGLGGPLYHLLKRFRLLKDPLLLCPRRIVAIAAFTWLPLLLLSLLSGLAFDGLRTSFFSDIEVHVRFLVVLSMLIYAEVIAHDRIHIIVEQFLKCNIVAVGDKGKFYGILASAMRLRDSRLVEITLVILVYTVGHWFSTKFLPFKGSSWLALSNNALTKLTPAGYWYVFVSLPIFQFILLRWYYRLAIWYRFLWQVSRLPLQLNSLHPDRAAGLGFLTNSIFALEPFLLAHSVLLSGMIFNRVWNAGAAVSDFKMEMVSVLIYVLLIPLIPLLFFMFQMLNEKRNGTLDYGVVANRYVNDFRQKWISARSKNSEAFLGTADIQSLADLSNSYEVSNKMRITPFSRGSLIALAIFTALPLFPLALTVIPLEKIIGHVVGLIF